MSLNSVLVDLASGGSSWKQPVRASSITNITLSGLQTIDAIVLALGDRVGVFGQTNPVYNGIYIVKETAWVRAADFDRPEYVQLGSCALVLQGSARAKHLFMLTAPTSGEIRVGVTNLTFTDQGIPGTNGATVDVEVITTPSGDLAIGEAGDTIAIRGVEIDLQADALALCETDQSVRCSIAVAEAFVANFASAVTSADFRHNGSSRIKLDANDVTLNASASGKISLCEGAVEYMNIQNISGAPTFTCGGLNMAFVSGSQVQMTCASLMQISSGGFYCNGASIVERTAGFATILSKTVATAYVENFASGVTCDRQINGSSRIYIDADGVRFNGQVRYTAVITPAAIGTTQLLYQPANILTSRRVNQDVSAACIIQTILAGTDGQRITLRNHSNTPANTLTLLADDGATGTAANRIRCPNNANFVIRCNGAAELEYCGGALNRWTVIAA